MGSNSKSLKLSKPCQLGSDIISSLPCGVIGHILSFIPTKEAVSTSILSTKWKDIWHLIPKLDLKDNSFSAKDFTGLIYRLLLQRRGSHLSDFYLNCHRLYDYDPLDVNAWIKSALLCKVQQVDISLSLKNCSFLSRELFSSTTLAVLKLEASFVMNIPSFVYLPNLKIVDLSFVKFLDDDSLTRFICGCPVLEELTLCRCLGDDIHTINIVSPLLTRLVLKDMPFDGTYKFEPAIKCKIVINTPSLKYLEMKNFFAGGYLIVDLHNLIEAHVAISSDFVEVLPADHAAISDYTVISDLLKEISNVQSLHLSWFDIVYNWPEDYFQLPEFSKLSCLELIVDNKCDLLSEMLENSPCVETLVYKEVDNPSSSTKWKNESRAFDCCSVSKSLKVIEIEILHGLTCADKMVLFFSKNAKALEKLIVQSVNWDNELEDDLEMVTCFLKNEDKKIKKFTMENISRRLRKWVFDYIS